MSLLYRSALFFVIILLSAGAMAQTVSGKVFDAQTKEPLAGITIQVPNTTVGTTYGSYDFANFRVGYQWHGIEVFSNILNATNVLFATNATRGNNATDRTTYTPAAPRTFTAGIQYNFTGKR